MTSLRNAPIGIFDSGLGGLTVLRALQKQMPCESTLFVADQAHVPYGGRPLAEVQGFAEAISSALFAKGCKAVVMACNISSATALSQVQSSFPGKIAMGTIAQGALEAASVTCNGHVGVLATEGTVKSRAFTAALNSIRAGLEVTEVACPRFVPIVEEGRANTEEAFHAAEEYIARLRANEVDTVVLGCTHYPFLLPALQKAAPFVQWVDPAQPLAEKLQRELNVAGLAAEQKTESRNVYYTTADPDRLRQQSALFLNCDAASLCVRSAYWQEGVLHLP